MLKEEEKEWKKKIIWKNKTWSMLYVDDYKVYVNSERRILICDNFVCVKVSGNTKCYITSGIVFKDTGDYWQLVKVQPNNVELQLVVGS